MAAYDYWSATYWNANYYVPEYWAAVSSPNKTGQIDTTLDGIPAFAPGEEYWSDTYYSANYFGGDYFGGGVRGAAFTGTFNPPGQVSGTVSVTLEPFDPAITGPVAQALIFDVSVAIAVPWTITEFGFTDGSIDITSGVSPERSLEDHAAAFVGSFVEEGGTGGLISTTLGDGSANFDGTTVGPGSFSGTIGTTLGLTVNDIVGQHFQPGTSIGSINVTLGALPTVFLGTMAPGNKTGTIADTLDDFSSGIPGFFSIVDVVDGALGPTLGNHTAAFTGTNVALVRLNTPANRTMEIPFEDRICVVGFEDRTFSLEAE